MAPDVGRRPAVAFVHGYSCSWRHWGEAKARLGDVYDVLLVSLPGHGGTPLPARGGLDFADCVTHIVTQLEASGPPGALLVGHSLGGMLGIACVHQRPDLFSALILVDAFPKLSLPPFDRSFWEGSPPALKSHTVREMMETRRGLPDSLWESVAGFDGRRMVAEMPRPVRGVYGDRGEGDHEALAKSLLDLGLGAAPDAGISLIADAGHFVMLEQPAAFYARLRDVLGELASPRG